MEITETLIISVVSFVLLFVLTKIMGNKQMSELNMFDYIIGISIGSIAAEMATSLRGDVLQPVIAMVVFALMAVLFAVAGNKSMCLRRFLVGKSLILYDKKKFFKKNLKKARLDLSEVLNQCRAKGFFDLSDVETMFLEPNGKISILPKSTRRPCNPEDLGITPKEQRPPVVIISDGTVLQGNLSSCGRDNAWLMKELKKQNLDPKGVTLAVLSDGNLQVYTEQTEKPDRDIFQ